MILAELDENGLEGEAHSGGHVFFSRLQTPYRTLLRVGGLLGIEPYRPCGVMVEGACDSE